MSGPATLSRGVLRGLGDAAAAAAASISSALSILIRRLPVYNFKPANWENIDQFGYIALGAQGGAAVVIVSFTCPPGRNGIIHKVANNFVGAGWVEGSGSVKWQILVDGAPPPGATNYDNILGSLGNPASPTEIDGFRIYENQVLTLVAFNVGIVVAGQQVGGRLVGYTYPREEEDQGIWL